MLFLNISKMFSLWLALAFQLNGLLIYCYSLYRKSVNDKLVSYYGLKRSLMLKKLKAMKMRRLSRKSRSVWVKQGRSDMWWANFISGLSPEEVWKKNFRINKAEFLELCTELRPYVSPKGNSPNYRSLTLEKKVAIVLYFFKDTGSLWMTANTFGVHQCTVSKVVVEVCTAITDHLASNYIKLPSTMNEMHEKVSEFELKYGMAQAFGCIDGIHIPIKTPAKDSQDFFNYKHFF